jgi:hypothetical protein
MCQTWSKQLEIEGIQVLHIGGVLPLFLSISSLNTVSVLQSSKLDF